MDSALDISCWSCHRRRDAYAIYDLLDGSESRSKSSGSSELPEVPRVTRESTSSVSRTGHSSWSASALVAGFALGFASVLGAGYGLVVSSALGAAVSSAVVAVSLARLRGNSNEARSSKDSKVLDNIGSSYETASATEPDSSKSTRSSSHGQSQWSATLARDASPSSSSVSMSVNIEEHTKSRFRELDILNIPIKGEGNGNSPLQRGFHDLGREFLNKPRLFYKQLRGFTEDIFENSALASFLKLMDPKDFVHQPEKHNKYENSNTLSGNTSSFKDYKILEPVFTGENLIRMCQNIMVAVCSNIKRLQNQHFIQDQISLLVVCKDRESVASLAPLPVQAIINLKRMFDTAVDDSMGKANPRFTIDILLDEDSITAHCLEVLRILNLSLPSESAGRNTYSKPLRFTQSSHRIWHDTVRLLDLAIVLYAGAHIDPLPYKAFQDPKILGPVFHDDDSYRYLDAFELQSCSLKCLSPPFLGKKVWVLRSRDTFAHNEIYISAKAETVADIWGPMWKVHQEDNDLILQYNFGGGSLVPWDFESGQSHPVLRSDERLAHWLPYDIAVQNLPASNLGETSWGNDDCEADESSESEMENLQDQQRTLGNLGEWVNHAKANPFTGQEQLLIGAPTSPKFVRGECRCSVRMFTHELKETGCLHYLETSKLFRFVDTRNINMIAGSHGFTLGAGITIKTQFGRSWKEVLLDVWENEPNARHPKSLGGFWGIFLSLCTFNAQRVRLVELLSTESVCNLLKPFKWSSELVKEEFFKAVLSSNPFAICTLWEEKKGWQEEIGKVLLICLRALCQTGYDSNRKEFYALWMSPKSRWPKRVVLRPAEHSWVSLLQDSEDSCAVAVVVKSSLIGPSRNGFQNYCPRPKAPSKLETAIAINSKSIEKMPLRKVHLSKTHNEEWRTLDYRWSHGWNVSKIGPRQRFPLRTPQGRLEVIRVLSESHLLLKWENLKRNKILGFFGLEATSEEGHWEYTDDDDLPPVRPVPVHVESDK